MLGSIYSTIFGEAQAPAPAPVSKPASETVNVSSTVVEALDTKRMPDHTGENGHPEFTWNSGNSTLTDLRERAVQVFYQLVRVKSFSRKKELGELYSKLLTDVKSFDESPERDHLLRVLWGLLTHTRDCVKGKGERDLSYSLLLSAFDGKHVDEDEFIRVVAYWVGFDTKTDISPPGSWKDVVNLCNFIGEWYKSRSSVLITRLIRLLNEQLLRDETSENPSLAAKWAPRESSKQKKWLFKRLVTERTPTLQSKTDSSLSVSLSVSLSGSIRCSPTGSPIISTKCSPSCSPIISTSCSVVFLCVSCSR
jgi:hypothetical protein